MNQEKPKRDERGLYNLRHPEGTRLKKEGKVDDSKEVKPALTPEEVEAMIVAAKERLAADAVAFLALATTYGLRLPRASAIVNGCLED